MKDIINYLLESNVEKKNSTVGDFVKWACLGSINDKATKIEPDDCQSLLDNGWDEYFSDSKEISEFINKNWKENVKIISKKTYGGWDVSMSLDGKEYTAGFSVKYLDSEYSLYKSK